MAGISDNRRRLADLMERRRLELGLRWKEVAEAGGISYEAIRAIRSGDADIRPLTRRGIEAGLRWEPDSVQRILAGGDPVPAATAATRPTGIKVIDEAADEKDLQPFIWQVEREVERAEASHGGGEVSGEAIFGPGHEADAWNSPIWDRGTTIRMLATFRLFAYQNRGGESGVKTGLGRFRVLSGSP